MNKFSSRHIFSVVGGIILCAFLFAPNIFAASLQQSQRSGAEIKASFQYLLSNFSGSVPSMWARIDFEPQQQEIYTLDTRFNEVRIFNRQGMEVFGFGTEEGMVAAADLAAGDGGLIYVLARNFQKHAIQVFNFRGQPKAVITLKDVPEQFQGFAPDLMEYQDGRFYLLESAGLRLLVVADDGTFMHGYDLTAKFDSMVKEQDPEKKKVLSLDISGFGLGPDGSMYFTAPTLFSAFRLNADGSLDIFGDSGSGPGKFGVVSGIVADDLGNIYVADRLRSVVMIFDHNFIFLGEFGYRGGRPEDMIVPDDLMIDMVNRRVFVAQAANKGVGVYKVSVEQSR